MNIFNLTTPIAFLNGSWNLDDHESDLFKALSAKEPILLDGLFSNPEKLLQLSELSVKTIVVQTTGQNGQEVNKLVDFFERMNFIPENVVFIFTKLLHIGREFKKVHPETNFFIWWHDDELEHLEKLEDF
jgi:hypothetical protein